MPDIPMHLINQTEFNKFLVDEMNVVFFLFSFMVVAVVSKCGCSCYNTLRHECGKCNKRRNLETLHAGLLPTSSAICSICLEDYSNPDIKVNKLPCSHLYHKDCIQEWLHDNDSCPECRSEI